ncbi:MAG: HU family DNA-binding protein [Ardenticatenaceae bacterium]|nr:HU family DNA-binding protein [Anaerolineales bacterium]MCB8923279.1 HU family DNA-binding protein [Ardenticatenaceae bacterium]
MTIKYNVMPRRNPRDTAAPSRYYPVVKSSGRTNQRGLAQKGVKMSTLSVADMAAATEIFLDLIPEELMAGNIVDLGDFGSFRVIIKAEGSDTPEEVNATKIIKVNVRFTPGKAFKDAMHQAVFEKL